VELDPSSVTVGLLQEIVPPPWAIASGAGILAITA